MTRIRRAIALAVIVCTLTTLAGCATHATSGDPAVPEEERAVVAGYARYLLLYFEDLQIVSVDGRRVGEPEGLAHASSVSVPAGRHWIQVSILRNGIDTAMCAFEWTFEARHRYKLHRVDHDQLLLAHPASPRFQAAVVMDVAAPSKPAQRTRARAECGDAVHCRRTADCPTRHACETSEDFDFGICRSSAR